MATLYITEFIEPGAAHGRSPSMGQQGAVATQTVAIGGSSTASAAFNANTNMVRLHNDNGGPCSIIFSTPAQLKAGTTPTATTSHPRMAANQTEYYGVIPGQIVAVISNT